MPEILHELEHALVDTLKLLPWLVLIYVIIELLEHKTELGGKNSRLNGRLGPLIGSATGLIPQCGFSVMAAKLFEQKYITVGTLLAIFLSTSDEAFVILLADGAGASYLLPLIVAKITIGVSMGYLVDGVVRFYKRGQTVTSQGQAVSEAKKNYAREMFLKKAEGNTFGCTSCGRPHDERNPWKLYFLYPVLHALKIAAFVFAVTFAFGVIIHFVGEESFGKAMQKSLWIQPILAVLIGLIPNCASSVVLTTCLLEGRILFGSCVAGLCANAGLGFVVLLKNTKKWKRNLLLILTVTLISVGMGFLLNGLSMIF